MSLGWMQKMGIGYVSDTVADAAVSNILDRGCVKIPGGALGKTVGGIGLILAGSAVGSIGYYVLEHAKDEAEEAENDR